MKEIDFNKIHSNKGPSEGFENLVCYLARQTSNRTYLEFIDNNGAGGDGGVECYWKLKNNDEYGWQAKYFLDPLNESQWQQITTSVITAIKRHPRLTKYYICLPHNLSDSRKERQGIQVTTERDKWNTHVLKWKQAATKHGISLDFVLWDASKIQTLILQSPQVSTIADYWFGEKILTLQNFIDFFKTSTSALKRKYLEKINIPLPIMESLNALVENDFWSATLETFIADFHLQYRQIENWSNNNQLSMLSSQAYENATSIKEILSDFKHNKDYLFNNRQKLVNCVKVILDQLKQLLRDPLLMSDSNQILVSNCQDFFEKFQNLLTSRTFQAREQGVLLINGPAGSGKSHLLYNFSYHLLQSKHPVIYLPGQSYSGGDPVSFIKEKLHIPKPMDNFDLLEMYGEVIHKKVFIIIDAVNEGTYRNEWKNYIIQMIETIKSLKHVCLIISCRTTYQNQILGPDILDAIPFLTHPGFSGCRAKAARTYLTSYGIEAPNVPFLPNEFTNPLFLETICTKMKENQEHSFPKELTGLESILNYYRADIESIVAGHLGLSSSNTVRTAIDCFVDLIYLDHLWGVPYEVAYAYYQKKLEKKDIFESLIHEDILLVRSAQGTGTDTVHFALEKFTDIYVTERLLDKFNSLETLKQAFLPNNELGKYLINHSTSNGVIELMSVEVPERFGHELVDIIQWNQPEFIKNSIQEQNLINNAFADSLTLRTPDSFTKRTLELFHKINGPDQRDKKIKILIRLSLEINHPWNAFYLDHILQSLELPQRDAFWTTFLAINDHDETYEQPESEIRSIINWALETPLQSLSEDIHRLLGIVLIWFTPTVNLKTRNDTERALARLLLAAPNEISYLSQKFSFTDDSYLVDSLYNCIYAAIQRIDEISQIQNIISNIPWEHLAFSDRSNIILRDSLTGIYEYAKAKGADTSAEDNFFPIHKTRRLAQLHVPSQAIIDNLPGDPNTGIKRSAGTDNGYVGRYILWKIDAWSSTRFDSAAAPLTRAMAAENFFSHQDPQVFNYFKKYKEFSKRKNEIQYLPSTDSKKNSHHTFLHEFKPNLSMQEKEEIQQIREQISILEILIFHYVSLPDVYNYLIDWNSTVIDTFDRKAAQRWVVNRAYSLGWKKELFEEFENQYSDEYRVPNSKKIERIGKKYEFIAFAELLAHITEQYYFMPYDFEDTSHSEYKGIWQLKLRNHDITFPPLTTFKKAASPWEDPRHTVTSSQQPPESLDHTNTVDFIHDISKIICTKTNLSATGEWLVLSDLFDTCDSSKNQNSKLFKSFIWYDIKSCVIKTEDLAGLLAVFQKKPTLINSDPISFSTNFNQMYFSEYPWRKLDPHWEFTSTNLNIKNSELQKVQYQSLLYVYNWEDLTHFKETQVYLPSREIIADLELGHDGLGTWKSDNNPVFIDPSIKYQARSRALMQKDYLCSWLRSHGTVLVWIINGEKRVDNSSTKSSIQRKSTFEHFSAVCYLNAGGIIAGMQFPCFDSK